MQLRKDKCQFKGMKGMNVTSQNPEFEKLYFFLPNYCCQKPKTATLKENINETRNLNPDY